MDESVAAAMAKWPNVPACYGWLALDRRGQWRLQDEVVRHPGLETFLSRNYGHDEAGNWFVQNGPQKVYATLAYTPWVFRLGNEQTLLAHDGQTAGTPQQALLDEDGNLLLLTERGLGAMDDRDMPAMLHHIMDSNGKPASEEALMATMAGEEAALVLNWHGLPLALQTVRRGDVASRFGFVTDPAP